MLHSLKDRFNSTGPSRKKVNHFTRAAVRGDTKGVKKFLDKYKDAVNRRDDDGQTALMMAVAGGQSHIAELLLDSGADTTIKNNAGKSALIIAAANKDLKMAKLLAQWPKIQKKKAAKQKEDEKILKKAERKKAIGLLKQKHRLNKGV